MDKGKRIKIVKSYSESLKLKAVSEIESGELSQAEASRHYGCTKGAIYSWMQKYSKLDRRTKLVRVSMKSEADKIKELESSLSRAHLKLELYEAMMELAKKDHGLEIKKNTSTQEYELLKDGKKSVKSVKNSR
jgi:transposase-like protein